MTVFDITAGRLSIDGNDIGPAYSGAPGSVDDPTQEAVVAHGPIPEGLWTIGEPATVQKLGPYAMALTPVAGTETFGRSAFFIHGDNGAHDQSASEGCIVAGPLIREAIWADPDHMLSVVA